ncbi:hypothetical protein [Bifidobacterium sp. SO1]|uniref:hypothetical protein n=1 Tax=Bifidobacterium sp. SO1 TaxID=2809029 RepID=UPI001BDBF0D3|nr:hypothetical protein [Bifidobacterium sp. SO1]MBT1161692.1 hypothetical protein [Bifidobacterium sp. SO1]
MYEISERIRQGILLALAVLITRLTWDKTPSIIRWAKTMIILLLDAIRQWFAPYADHVGWWPIILLTVMLIPLLLTILDWLWHPYETLRAFGEYALEMLASIGGGIAWLTIRLIRWAKPRITVIRQRMGRNAA